MTLTPNCRSSLCGRPSAVIDTRKELNTVQRSLEFVRSTFVVHGSYYYAILNWGNFPVLSTIVWYVHRDFQSRNSFLTDLYRSMSVRLLHTAFLRDTAFDAHLTTDPPATYGEQHLKLVETME